MAITASVVMTQSGSGVAPEFVFIDCTATTASGLSYPYHELEYKIDWGDSGSGNFSVTGNSKNISYGAIAGHVYESAGDYIVTVTITQHNGSGGITDQEVLYRYPSVVDPDGSSGWGPSNTNTVVYSTDGNFTGAPSGATQRTYNPGTNDDWDDVITYLEAGKRVLLKAGQTFTVDSNYSFSSNSSKAMLGRWGSGDDPKIATAGYNVLRNFNDVDDVRFVDIEIDGSAYSNTGKAVDGWPSPSIAFPSHVTFLRCNFHDLNLGILFDYQATGVGGPLPNFMCIQETQITNMDGGSGANSLYWAAERSAVLGCDFEDTRGAEHVVRWNHAYKCLMSNTRCAYANSDNVGATKGEFTTRCSDYGGSWDWSTPLETKYILCSDCKFFTDGGSESVNATVEYSSIETHHRDYIYERNEFHTKDSPSDAHTMLSITGKRMTVRNNVFFGPRNGTGFVATNTADRGQQELGNKAEYHWFYNNTAYVKDGSARFWQCTQGAKVDYIEIKNACMYAPECVSLCLISYVLNGPVPNLTTSNNTSDIVNDNPGWTTADPTTPTGMRLSSTSDNKNSGATIASVWEDFEHTYRPQTSHDIGAFEYYEGIGPPPFEEPAAVQPVPISGDYTVFMEF